VCDKNECQGFENFPHTLKRLAEFGKARPPLNDFVSFYLSTVSSFQFINNNVSIFFSHSHLVQFLLSITSQHIKNLNDRIQTHKQTNITFKLSRYMSFPTRFPTCTVLHCPVPKPTQPNAKDPVHQFVFTVYSKSQSLNQGCEIRHEEQPSKACS